MVDGGSAGEGSRFPVFAVSDMSGSQASHRNRITRCVVRDWEGEREREQKSRFFFVNTRRERGPRWGKALDDDEKGKKGKKKGRVIKKKKGRKRK